MRRFTQQEEDHLARLIQNAFDDGYECGRREMGRAPGGLIDRAYDGPFATLTQIVVMAGVAALFLPFLVAALFAFLPG